MKKTILAAFAFLALGTGAFAQQGRTGRPDSRPQPDPRSQPGANGSWNNGYDTNPNYGNTNNGYGNNGYGNGGYGTNSGNCNNGYGTNGGYNNGYGNSGYSYVRSHPIYRNVMAARLPLYEQRSVLREISRIEQMEWAFGRNGRMGPREEALLNRELAQLDARLQRDYRRGYVRY